jgi:hypothetical protein
VNSIEIIEAIKRKFIEGGYSVKIPLQKGGFFKADLTGEGVNVDNLGNQPSLPWVVFQEAFCVLVRNGGRAARGNAMNAKLGEEGLPLDSVEGHIAHIVYGKQVGETVFRRISPIAGILIWAGVCTSAPNELILKES